MALAPIALSALQYEDFANQYIKAFEQGTTTPKTMATDITGDTTASKFQLNTQGFPITAGSALVIPFIDGPYDLWIFPTAAEADANDTSNALQIADNIIAFVSGKVSGQESTTATMTANTNNTYVVGDVVQTKEFSTGNGGGGTYDVVLTTSVTPNTFNVILSVSDPLLSFVLRANNDIVDAAKFGATGDGATDDTAAIQAALDYVKAVSVATNKSRCLLHPGRRYITSAALNIPAVVTFDITGTEVFCSDVTVLTFGNGSTLIGNNAEIVSSGAAGSAVKRLDQSTSSGMNIFGWPQLTPSTQRVSGSIGFDALASFRANLEIFVTGYDIGIRVGGMASPNSFYCNLVHPTTIACNTGILIGERSNGWTITHPQVSGSNLYRTGILVQDCVGGVIMGGYVEAFEDNVNSRGLLFDGATDVTVLGTNVEANSTVANAAIGMINNASDLTFINCRPGAGWNSGGKVIINSGTGKFSWSGLNPFTGQMITLLAARKFIGDEAQGSNRSYNDVAGLTSCAKFQMHKIGTAIVGGQFIGAVEFAHEDETDPGLVGRMHSETESGFDGSSGLVFSTGSASTFAPAVRIDSAQNFASEFDNLKNLGNASKRWKEIFAGNATINTSDRNEKTDIADIDEVEKNVAVKIKATLKKFRFIDAVDQKGEGARIHFGVIAQEVFDAFASEGLNAERYSLYCSDTWYEAVLNQEVEEGVFEDRVLIFSSRDKIPEDASDIKEKTRLGIRASQLMYFMMSTL